MKPYWYTNDNVSTSVCSIYEGDCNEVQNSEYSTFLGVSLSIYGIFLFSILTILLSILFLISIKNEKTIFYKYDLKIKKVLKLMILMGLLISIYLIYLQKYVVGSFCNYCLVIDGIMILIAIFYLTILN